MKKLINIAYGLGGAIIMVGILFKMTGDGNADTVLTVGLITEAVVFAIMAFDFSGVQPSSGSWRWVKNKEPKK